MRPKEGFADVNIAQSRNDSLIQKGGFDRRVATLEGLGEIGFVKGVAQWLWPQLGQKGMRLGAGGVHQVHRAKAAGVVKGNPRAALHMKHDMIVLFGGGVIVDKATKRVTRNQHPPRHAKMDQKRLTRGQIGKDVL